MLTTDSWLFTRPIAHRGLHCADIPENSLKAFEAAIQHGYAIELDVHLTDDHNVIVFHDDTLYRMTGQDGYVSNLNAETLQNYKLEKTDQCIPLFSEVLQLVNGQVPLLIEIKSENAAVGLLEKALMKELSDYKGEYAIQSFNPYTLLWFKENYPDVLRGQLSCFFTDNHTLSALKKSFLKRMKFNKKTQPDFVSYCNANLPNKYVSKYVATTGGCVLAWTIRSEEERAAVAPYCNNFIFENFIPTNTNNSDQ